MNKLYLRTAFSLAFLSGAALAASATTLTGRVSDTMCGKQHMMAGNGAACARGCVKKGSGWALVSGNKVYALKSHKKAVLATLNKEADKNVTVSGSVKGNTVWVSSVKPAK